MSTTVVYASGESGYIQCADVIYLTAARGDGTSFSYVSSNFTRIGQRDSGSAYYCYETFLTWDTSAVGTDTVSNVDFEVDGAANASTTDFTVEGYAYDWGSTLENADFRDSDAGIPALGSIISSYDTSGGFDTGTGYNNDLGANAAFASAINGAGDTRIVVLSSRHRTETEVTVDEYCDFECTGATNDARLTITHASVTYTYAKPDADITTTGWTSTPLWSKVDDDPASPDATVITASSS